MSLQEKPPIPLDRQTPTARPTGTTTNWKHARRILRLASPIVITGVVLATPVGSRVLAKSAAQDSAKSAPNIDPGSMEALNKMGTYLRSLKSFQVDSEISTDDVLDDGEIVTDTRKDTLLAVRPNLLRVEMKGDDIDTFLFYDGKNFTVYGKLVNFYATVPAPSTITELVDKVDNDYGIEIPLVDLFRWGTDQSTISKITSAIDLGPATIDDVTCEHYAFRQEGIDWQIWIQLGDFPLPRKLAIRTLTDEARPLHISNLTWNLAPSYNEAAFTFDPPQGAGRIPIKDIKTGKATN